MAALAGDDGEGGDGAVGVTADDHGDAAAGSAAAGDDDALPDAATNDEQVSGGQTDPFYLLKALGDSTRICVKASLDADAVSRDYLTRGNAQKPLRKYLKGIQCGRACC